MEEEWRETERNGEIHTGAGMPKPCGEETARAVCKAARKQFSKLGWMFVAGTAVIYAVQFGIGMIVGLLQPEWLTDPDGLILLSMLPMYLIGIPILVLMVKTIPAVQPERHRMKGGQFALAFLICYAAMYVCNIAGTLLTNMIGYLKGSPVRNELQEMILPSNLLVIFFFTVICAPVIEEYVFRKLIVDRAIQYGQGVAIVLSGLMFGLFHGNLNQFIYTVSLGMLLAFLYVRTGNLKITIAIHMIGNFLGGVVSTQILKLVNMDAYMEAALSGDMQDMMAYLADHLAGWILFAGYLFLVLGCTIAGVVLFIVAVCKGRFRLGADKAVLPEGKKFATVILNSGMIAFVVVMTGLILWQLFA